VSPAIDLAIHVVAGALLDGSGQVLIAQRPSGKHMAGGWEFPGGKLSLGETPFAGLVRELREELNITVLTAEPIIAYRHDYADRSLLLDLWYVTCYEGKPVSAEGQSIKWVALSELDRAGLLEADRPMIEPLKEAIGRGR
jgi:8-oxo-dGTP diphosphatase